MTLTDTELGYIAVILAILFFGSFALPVKTPSVVKAQVDPAVFQLYYSVAVFASSWLILLYVPFSFTAWGIVGALLWVPSNILALNAINYIGMALAQGTWSGVTILVSFMWGTFVFDEAVGNWYFTTLALLFLLLGILFISLSNFEIPIQFPPSLSFLYYLAFFVRPSNSSANKINTEINSDSDKFVDGDEISLDSSPPPISSKQKWIIGMGCSVFLGLLNGSMLVPMQYVPPEDQGITYLYSFAIGVIIVTPVIVSIYFGIEYLRKRQVPKFHFKITVLPALLAGLLWNIGNYFSIYATIYLGLAVGFPLTQMALVVAGVWGMLIFKEIKKFSGILQFFLSAFVLLVGAFLLAIYG